jgi:hypothetical protein
LHRLSLSTALLVLAAGCEQPAAPSPSPTTSRARVDLPFHLTGDAVVVLQQFAPNAGPPDFGQSTFDERCSVPADLLLRFQVTGRATHLGAVTGVVEHCTQLDFTTFTAKIITDGTMVWTAANGDELWGEHHRPEGYSFELVEWVGGTGRFAEANGEAEARPQCDPSTGTCTLTVEGVLGHE